MTVTKKATNNKCWRGCGERGTLSLDGGNVNCGHMENSMEFPQKANTRTTVWSNNSTSLYISSKKKSRSTSSKRHVYPVVYSTVVQLLSCVQFFATPWTATHQASLSFPISQSLLRLMSIESVMPSNHLILCHFLLLLPSIIPSIRVFSNELALCIRWPKNWSFSFSVSPSNEYSGLISFRMDWFDLLAVQGTLKSLLQYHSSKASILWCSAFFMAQLSHPYMTIGKTIDLTRWTFVGKVLSLLF